MPSEKSDLRHKMLARRAAMSPFVSSQTIADLARWMYSLPVELTEHDTVAAYVATASEPGGVAMLDALIDRGLRVILPIVPSGKPQRLDWGRYRTERSLKDGRWGLQEPHFEPLGPDEIGRAKVILVPALAVDHTGARLGRGAGYYDRTLCDVDAPIIAVIHDAEFLDDGVPQDADDVRVDWVLTPGAGFTKVG